MWNNDVLDGDEVSSEADPMGNFSSHEYGEHDASNFILLYMDRGHQCKEGGTYVPIKTYKKATSDMT